MIKIENTEVVGWEHAIRGMRNPMNSWKRSDSAWTINDSENTDKQYGDVGPVLCKDPFLTHIHYELGENDGDLMMRLANGGPVHAKYRRMITVYLDITAPLYWWKEFDTYKVGTVANSCSTMHKIADKEFDISDFSFEHLETMTRFDEDGEPHQPYMVMKSVIDCLNACRKTYLKTKSKTDWWQMIQLLPSSYNQKRTIMLNYEVLNNIYHSRKDHKLDEWRDFCKWIEDLPYSEIITGKRCEVHAILEHHNKERYLMKDKFFYLCDGKMCEFCNPECYHTDDIAHAINFTHEPTEEERRNRFILIKSDPANLVNEYFERMEYVK